MRTREIALTVLFPIFIAVGFTLGMDAVSSTEFGYAQYAFQLAAALTFALSLLWFYETDFSWSVASVFVLTTSVTLAAVIGALEWVYLKENTHCLITADLTNAPTVGPGIYEFRIFGRTGSFREILTVTWDGQKPLQEWKTERVTIEEGRLVFTPMRWP